MTYSCQWTALLQFATLRARIEMIASTTIDNYIGPIRKEGGSCVDLLVSAYGKNNVEHYLTMTNQSSQRTINLCLREYLEMQERTFDSRVTCHSTMGSNKKRDEIEKTRTRAHKDKL